MRPKRIASLLSVILFASFVVLAQQEKKPLTNADVVTMIKAGLPESTIVLAIQKTPANFDTSPEGLIQLKNQGATPKILDAVLHAQGENTATPSTDLSASNMLGSSGTGMGVSMIDGPNHTEMKYNSTNLRTTGYNPVPFSSTKVRASFNGNQAQLRTTNSSPTFELSVAANAQPSEMIALVTLTVKSDRREITMGKAGIRGVSTGFSKDQIVPISIEEIPSDDRAGRGYYKRYRVKLVNPLPHGEYALVVSRAYYDLELI